MSTFTTRDFQPAERVKRLAGTSTTLRGLQRPSERYGCRWAALPVEGSKAWRDQRPSIVRRLFS